MYRVRLAFSFAALVAACAGGAAHSGQAIAEISDEFDNLIAVNAVRDRDTVTAFRAQIAKFEESLLQRKMGEIERLVGAPVPMPLKSYALSIAQPRLVALPGAGRLPSKRHTRFYRVQDSGGLQVWYGDDGETPILVVVRLKVDKSFPRVPDLSPKNLAARLAWERERFDKLVKFVEEREKEVNKEKKK